MYLKTPYQILVIGTLVIMNSSYRTTGVIRTNCSGSSNGMSEMGVVVEGVVEALRLQYQNCTKVYGNLEITKIKPDALQAAGVDSLDFIFHHLEEVTGYVLIFRNSIPSISLPRLKIIWGDELFQSHVAKLGKKYSLVIFDNSNLKHLDLRNLRAIQQGDIGVTDRDPCYLIQTIDWGQILDDKERFRMTRLDNAAPTCKEAYGDLPCDASCRVGNGSYCWGPSADMCQQMYKNEFCSPSCDKGCFEIGSKSRLHCCHQSCIAGCNGPSASDCVACSYFKNDGKCVDACPALEVYSPSAQMHVKNPNGKYTYIRDCIDKCPSHTVIYSGGCAAKCPPGFHYLDGSRQCQKCVGACPKICSLGDPQLNSVSLRNLTNCTILEGNMEILSSAFAPNYTAVVNGELIKMPGIRLEDLNALQYLRRITGSLRIEVGGIDLRSLAFLRSLEVIEGRKVYNDGGKFALQITSNHFLMELRLVKLRRILNGGVFIAKNQDLCLVDSIPWENEILSQNDSRARAKFYSNMNEKRCEDDTPRRICADVCDPTTGCWGRRVSDCFNCRHMKQDDVCVAECNNITHYSDDKQRICLPCHLQCNGCNGSTDYNCTMCRNAKKDGKCVESCGLNHFKNDVGDCVPCHPDCMHSEGCTGSSEYQGPDGCNVCKNAVKDPINNNKLKCLGDDKPRNELCRGYGFDGYYAAHTGNENARVSQYMCTRCHENCQQCLSFGDLRDGAHGCECIEGAFIADRHNGSATACVRECDRHFYAENPPANEKFKRCRPCDAECSLGCTGPAPTECRDNVCAHVQDTVDDSNGEELIICLASCPEERMFDNNGVCGEIDLATTKKRQFIIIGSIVGLLLVVLLVVAACCFTYRRKFILQKFLIMPPEIEQGDYFNPDAKPNMANLRLINEMELRINRDTILGSGAFGIVYAGIWKSSHEGRKYPVAIKELQDTSQKAGGIGSFGSSETEMLEEAGIMASMSHPNLLPLIGVCLSTKAMILVTPFMPLGSVLDYMEKYRDNIGSYALLLWCRQIAEGMEHLENNRLVHRDLAARNVLVYRPNMVKVTDFGLAKMLDVGQSEVYVDGKVPIKWLAIESIRHKLFTHKSDVWAYGVTVWELLELGRKRPYEGVPLQQIPSLLESGTRLDQPANCTMDVFMVMIKCWMVDADSRPNFAELQNTFEKFLQDPRRYLLIENDFLKRIPSATPYDQQQHKIMAGLDLDDVELSDYIANNNASLPSTPTSPSSPSKPLMGGEQGGVRFPPNRLQSIGSSRYQSDPANKFNTHANFHNQGTMPLGGGSGDGGWLATDTDNYLVPDAHQQASNGGSRNGSVGSLSGVGYLPIVTAPDGTAVVGDDHVYYNDLSKGKFERSPKQPSLSAAVENMEYFGDRTSPSKSTGGICEEIQPETSV